MSEPAAALRHYADRIESALSERIPPPGQVPERLHAAMRYAVLNGGKRLRAALVYATGKAFGADPELLDVPACAVELIHAYSLVHDDLPAMDDDDLRRGKPTCHRAFDEPTAILAGDALHTLAFDLLATDPALTVPTARRLRMVGALARAAGSHGMAGGQAIDLVSTGNSLAIDQLETMHRLKTGTLIRAAAVLGALSAPDTDEETIATIGRFGDALGLAFQIVDDILDETADAATLGKNVGVDRALNKPTYASTLGIDLAYEAAAHHRDVARRELLAVNVDTRALAELADFVVRRRH